MKKKSRSPYAILGLLTYGPMSGYDIRQLFENSLSFFWNESYGQIYPTLKGLVEAGLVTVELEQQQDRPDRKLYTITEQGVKELRAYLAEPPRASLVRNELLLRVFFGGYMEPDQMRSLLLAFQQEQQATLNTYDAAEAAFKAEGHPDEKYWSMTLNYGRHYARAMIDWVNETLAELESDAQNDNKSIQRSLE